MRYWAPLTSNQDDSHSDGKKDAPLPHPSYYYRMTVCPLATVDGRGAQRPATPELNPF